MGDGTGIEWTDASWNVFRGCSRTIRVADRPFKVGDVLRLREWVPVESVLRPLTDPIGYTGRTCDVEVTYLTPGGEWGLPDSLCVMSIRKVEPALGTAQDTTILRAILKAGVVLCQGCHVPMIDGPTGRDRERYARRLCGACEEQRCAP
jgi:hypothetical protein